MSSSFKRLSNNQPPQVANCALPIQNDRIEVIKKLNEKLETFHFENSQNLKKLQSSLEDVNNVVVSHSDKLNVHQDNNEDLKVWFTTLMNSIHLRLTLSSKTP